MTFRQYGASTDWSGGSSHQLGFTDNGNIWQRTGSSTAWGAWKRLLDSSNYTSYSPSLTGSGASGSWGISVTGSSASCTGNAATATSATFLNAGNYINRRGGSGNANTDFQNTPAGSMSHQGDDANATNSPGNTWWFYDNYRHSNGSNYWGTQVAWGWEDNANRLATRNITGGTFGSWVYYLNSSNYTSYAPSLTGSGASGTWGINVTGSSASCTGNSATSSNTSSISNAVGGSYTWTAVNYFQSNLGATSGALSSPPLQAYSTGNNSAFMSFHKGGHYAVNFGLDSDNVLRIGGWSASANRWQLDMSGNMTAAGNVTAYSDIRLKDNIEPIKNALEKVSQINGVTFTRNDQENKTKRHAGVIAQEVEKVLPEVVSEDNQGIKNVAYGNMMGLMIEAIKELKGEIEELKSKIPA
jgi:hypothetical protein